MNTELNWAKSRFFLLISMLLCSWTSVFAQRHPSCCLPHLSDSVSEKKISIDFRINSSDIDSAYLGNARNLNDLHRLLNEVRSNPLLSLLSLHIVGYASPDGLLPKNKELSLRRAVSLGNYLDRNCGVPDSLMSFGENSVPWDIFRDLIAASDYPWSDQALRIINVGCDSSPTDNTRRMNRLKNLARGEAWTVIRRDILPRLRSAYVVTATLIRRPAPVPVPSDTVAVLAVTDSPLLAEPADAITLTPPSQIVKPQRDYDRFAIKSDAAYLAIGVANIGGEMALARHWSIDLPIVYSPYTLAQNYRLRFLYMQPEARYWLDRSLVGHFFGIHAHVGVANISLDHYDRYQTPDGFYGGGISYGYSLPVAKRWSIELTIGAGYLFTKYDAYYNIGIPQGMRYEKGCPLSYWGIDKVGINIVYRFGDKSSYGKEVVK